MQNDLPRPLRSFFSIYLFFTVYRINIQFIDLLFYDKRESGSGSPPKGWKVALLARELIKNVYYYFIFDDLIFHSYDQYKER